MVQKTNTATKALRALPIPIRKRTDGTENLIIPVKRKKVHIPKKVLPNQKPEYEVQMAAYESILETISSMVDMMERSPGAFAKMKEEDFRTVLLVAMNALYEGQATGETFSGYGKADIRISAEGRSVFIGEFLVWHGEGHLRKKWMINYFNTQCGEIPRLR